jgi:hypothetical protein
MPVIDSHVRIAAILHIVMGAIALLVLLVVGAIVAAVGTFGMSLGLERDVAAWVGGVGLLLVALFAVIVIAEIVGGVMLLRGSELGRAMTIVFSALSLLNIPIGTAIGAYSLWALLRAVPQLQSGSAPVRSGAAQSF